MMKHPARELILHSPLFTDWTEQYVRLYLPDTLPGTALELAVNGQPVPFQYTGEQSVQGAEVLVKLAFAKGERKTLQFTPCARPTTDLCERAYILTSDLRIGVPGCELIIPAVHASSAVSGPFAGVAHTPMASAIHCETAFTDARCYRTNDGPLFTDYALQYRFAEARSYRLTFRCYKLDPYIEVSEHFSLGMNAELVWTLNPKNGFTHIISRDSFINESQPTVEPLGESHPSDVLCRLQMPALGEYFIPNNRSWFAFFDARDESRGMVGILGLYGDKWQEPVANMPEVLDKDGAVEWHASLASGSRHWLLYVGPVEKSYSPERRFVFHRLYAEFNALRLDAHLDLGGENLFDTSCWETPGVFAAGDYHAAARDRLQRYACLQDALAALDDGGTARAGLHQANLRYLWEPTQPQAEAAYQHLAVRFETWVKQFQGYRTGVHDYTKSVIGFSRSLRGMLLAYEMLRRDGLLSYEKIGRLNAYFVFAARRILDEGRWPHSRTWQHPDHPESSRGFYTYGGEHVPDRLIWTNSLPNFQSDPMCALAHISAVFMDHPDAQDWLRIALDDLERQLDAYCGQSGAWEESINYALYTFSYFVVTFKVLKERRRIDYFTDARVRRFANWLCRFFGPYDKRFDAYTWPAIGNAVLPHSQGEYLLCYASELAEEDPLQADCLAVWQRTAASCRLIEHYPLVVAAMAPPELPATPLPLRVLESEVMDEVGVAMRDRHTAPDESYLFQKIGFAKDHYEEDETAFNWYAKGTPFLMDYGTYTWEVNAAAVHNVVEIPDSDALRRGYLADHLFTTALDYTRCEVPVTLKLLWGRVRTFPEVDALGASTGRTHTPYYYIGDRNPVGPKIWKVRQLLFVKPDYLVLFDRVYGEVPHRFNLHVTGTNILRQGAMITATGRFDLDLLAYVQHPSAFEMTTGELVPKMRPGKESEDDRIHHAQHYCRIYNQQDGSYRTVLFARERDRQVEISGVGEHGVLVSTPEYTDYLFVHNDVITVQTEEVGFRGRAGWIRRCADGQVQACVPDGEYIEAFGVRIAGRGPWEYNLDGRGTVDVCKGAPRLINVTNRGDYVYRT